MTSRFASGAEAVINISDLTSPRPAAIIVVDMVDLGARCTCCCTDNGIRGERSALTT
jgi:hypothetical protein